MPSNKTEPQTICILRLSAIGDICHAIAAVQAIHSRWPDAKITWIIGKVEARLIPNLPNIEFVVFDKTIGLKSYIRLRKQLKHRKFDILLHMQVAFRASLVTLCINAKERWGFDRQRAKEGQWLFTNRKIRAQNHPHVLEGFMEFARAIGVDKAAKPVWNIPFAKDQLKWAQIQCLSKPTLIIAPAASNLHRNWLPERYAAVADYAFDKGYTVILTGGPTSLEEKIGTDIINASHKPVVNLIGQTSLTQLLTLIRTADLVIAPDSGPAHMATIVNTPVIGLYAHSNPARTGPYNSLKTTVSIYESIFFKQTGKSINEIPWGKRLKGKNLMELISAESVIARFDTLRKENISTFPDEA